MLVSLRNNKSPGNDELTKEFYEMFWKEIKKSFHEFHSGNKRKKN